MNENDSGPLVLVVDDIEETRDGIERLLADDGYRVAEARDEEEAVSRAMGKGPDLVLISGALAVDIVATALRIRRRAELCEKVPFVIFCVQTIAEGAEVEVKRNVYLTRPDNFDQLRGLLSRLLRRVPAPS